MYFRFLLALLLSVGLCAGASAQNTAQPVITGYLTTSGCASAALTPCFVQYGAGGASTVTIGAPLGPQTGAASIAVICNSGCSGGPADESAFTAGTSSITTGGFFQTTATSNPLTNGQTGSVQLTANRAFMVNLRNAAGAESGVAAVPLQVSLANTAANGTAILTTGTGGTFPVTQGTSPWIVAGSGTAGSAASGVATIQGIASMTPVQVSQATAANLNATVVGAGAAGTANAGVVTVQGIASMTKLLVTPDSVALPANQSVNVAQVNGTTTLVNTGAVGTGAQRVAVGTDTATIAGSAPGTAGSASTNVVTVQGIASGTALPVQQSSQYPVGAVAETASATGTTGATTATLATNTGQTTSICGFSIRANATAAATNNATVTGTITGTLNFTQWTAPLASGLGVTEMIFTPCIPASTTNTSIAVISGAPGSGGVVSVSSWGFLK